MSAEPLRRIKDRRARRRAPRQRPRPCTRHGRLPRRHAAATGHARTPPWCCRRTPMPRSSRWISARARGSGRRGGGRGGRYSRRQRHRPDLAQRARPCRGRGRICRPSHRGRRGDELDAARAAVQLVDVTYAPLPAILGLREAMAAKALVAPEQRIARGDVAAAHGVGATPPLRRGRLRRPGSLLSGGADCRRGSGRGARHDDLRLDPASDRGAARRRPPARPAVQRRHRRGAAHGWRLRGQGEPGHHRGRHRRAPCRQGGTAGEAAPAARRRHVATGKRHDFLIRYDVGFDAEGRILALDMLLAANGGQRRRPDTRRCDAGALPRRQLLLPAAMSGCSACPARPTPSPTRPSAASAGRRACSPSRR